MISEHDASILELREWRLKLEKQIWNAAIETAAKIADETDKDYHDVAAAKIRMLKK